jgi:nucleoside-diphosphate-sugar epimerase
MYSSLTIDKPLAVLDLETTGIDYVKDRIVEIAVIKLLPDGSTEEKCHRLNPTIPIPIQASNVHGIYDKDVVTAIDKPIQYGTPYGTYNIGSGNSYSVLEIASTINEVFENEGNIEFDGTKLEKGGNIYMDIRKAWEILEWKPDLNLKEALIDLRNLENDE